MTDPQTDQPRVGAKTKGGVSAAIALIIGAVFAVEGGYVDHPSDPGGATNHGITEKVARGAGYEGDMRDLKRQSEDPDEVTAFRIYEDKYITAPGFKLLIAIDPVVAEEVIDTAVNLGPARPSRYFQISLNRVCGSGIAVDGKVGPATARAWAACRMARGAPVCRAMLSSLDRLQEAEYDRLVRVNPKLRVFRKGWQNHRIGNVDPRRC